MLSTESYVKTQITQTFLEMLTTYRMKDINIKALCQQAGVGRASFYRNFTSKEDILQQYSLKLLRQWSDDFEQKSTSKASYVFESLFQHFYDNKPFYRLLYEQDMGNTVLQTIKERFKFNVNLNNPDAYEKAFMSYAIYGWIEEWVKRGMQERPNELNKLLHDYYKKMWHTIDQIYDLD